MFLKLRNLLGGRRPVRDFAIPAGERVYAVGDIHGRLDLFEDLIATIEADNAARGSAVTTVILLGDLIDRGPDSAGVVARAREWGRQRQVHFIMGNHEEMLLQAREDIDTLRGFLKFGGYETLLSYGIDPDIAAGADIEELHRLLREAIPEEDCTFIYGFKKHVSIGDYLFVHAGIRPDMPLHHQQTKDCRWIREPFLSHDGDFGACVIHGHTITDEPEVRHNRIGIDTGAYVTNTLTAIGLEGTQRWFLSASSADEISAAA